MGIVRYPGTVARSRSSWYIELNLKCLLSKIRVRIGSGITRHIKGVCHFTLVTRSSVLDDNFLDRFRDCTFNYIHIDLANESAVRKLMSKSFVGVAHCAGVLSPDSIESNYNDILETQKAKVLGAHWIDMYGESLKHLWLFSSVSALWGMNDHYAYCYTNTYFDTLADSRQQRNLPVTVVRIGPVGAVGISAGHETTLQKVGL